jgi:hypothetical protein
MLDGVLDIIKVSKVFFFRKLVLVVDRRLGFGPFFEQ